MSGLSRAEVGCIAPECPRPHHAQGLCNMHYKRVKRLEARPIGTMRKTAPLDERLALTSEVAVDGCILYTGHLTPTGYGTFKIGRTSHAAHRVAYEVLVGPIPDGLELDHLCRVRHCISPDHLEPVTHAENLRRAWSWRKGGAA